MRQEREGTRIADRWSGRDRVVVFQGDNRQLLRDIPRETIQLIVTSPPYNVGKEYETKSSLEQYLDAQTRVIKSCCRVLQPDGSLCWQVGNHIAPDGGVVPLDALLYPIFRRHGLVLQALRTWTFTGFDHEGLGHLGDLCPRDTAVEIQRSGVIEALGWALASAPTKRAANGGEGGDSNPRTRLAGLTVFETAAFNRSATSPRGAPQGDDSCRRDSRPAPPPGHRRSR